jgi:hypothetical protein
MNRRNLVKMGALASAGALSAPTSFAIGLPSSAPTGLLAGLSAYSSRVKTATRDGVTHVLVSIDDLNAFADSATREKALPSEKMRAEGNCLSFSHRGAAYRIENVLPENFASRAGALS